MKSPGRILLPLIILVILLLGLFYFAPFVAPYRIIILAAAAVAGVVILLCTFLILSKEKKQIQSRMDNIFSENAGASAQVMQDLSVPSLLVDRSGNISWRNDALKAVFPDQNLQPVMPDYNFENPPAAYKLTCTGRHYQVLSMQIRRKSTDNLLTFQYWLDRTEAAHYQRLYEENRPYVTLIYIDNFDELSSDQQFHRTATLAEIERLISQFSESIGGIYRRYENGRFLLVFEAKHLKDIENSKFALLEQAHHIDTGTGTPISLSVGVGVADQLLSSDESANQALELALGRGGDQAIIKQGVNYTFYGGKRQTDAQQSRVKTRLFAKALRQLFENAGDVVIMGHRNADMDCFGGALGIVTCAKIIGSHAYIVLDDRNESIDISLKALKENPAYAGCIVSPEQAERMWKPSSVLVIVDTQRSTTTVAPALIGKASHLVLIDHHRRSADYIDNSTLHLLEARASSVSELITEMIQYFDDNPKLPPFISSALLAGITVDTKHFAFNVGSRTFEAAAYLRKNGADISVVKQMFQDDMASYQACAESVKNAEVIAGKVAVTCCTTMDDCEENDKLISAKIADQLINIKGIEAGFSLCHDGDIINVSGRSLGLVNVQVICERLGGGGHLTMAGAQLKDVTMEEALETVKNCIENYLKETNLA